VKVTLVGDACIDAGGATFSGDGHVELDLGGEYARGATFTLAFWLLKAPANAWVPQLQNDLDPLSSEILYSHQVPPGRGHLGITVMLRRGPWLGTWALIVLLDLDGVMSKLELHRDSVPQWTHVAILVDGTQILLLEDGRHLPTSSVSLAKATYFEYAGLGCEGPGWVGCEVHGEVTCGDHGAESGCTSAKNVACRNLCDTDHACAAFDIGTRGDQCCLHYDPEHPPEDFTLFEYGACSVKLFDWARQTLGALELTQAQRSGLTDLPATFLAAVGILGRAVFVGGSEQGNTNLHGALAMFQVYDAALEATLVQCVYVNGRQLVQSGRMEQTVRSECQQSVTTGCMSIVASDSMVGALEVAQSPSTLLVDDGSCQFDERPAVGEQGAIDVTDAWQRISLHGSSYTRPLVFTGVLTRRSTAQAVIRLRSVAMENSGVWSFEIRAEQKSCHFAKPPPTAERVSYLVVEAGVSEEGWQAGVLRAHDREWQRVSLLHRLDEFGAAPVVVSHVQNYDGRTEFVTTRHYLVPAPLPRVADVRVEPYRAFFVQVQTATSSANHTRAVAPEADFYADVGWLVCSPSTDKMHGQKLEASFAPVTIISTSVNFGARFKTAPIVLATIVSTGRLSAHLRLLEASKHRASIATEYDTCNFVFDGGDHLIGWIAISYPRAIDAPGLDTVAQRSTAAQDVVALLSIGGSLGLPDYLLWRNDSDPCIDRWAGVECRAVAGEDSRVVVLDVRSVVSTCNA
jgi:hypothetical protein